MRRLQLAEIHESAWCPASLRDAVTDTLRFYTACARPFAAIEARLAAALRRSGETRVLDLCSGAGGPWPSLLAGVERRLGARCRVTLSDLHPNPAAAALAAGTPLHAHATPVDARAVPEQEPGFRTLFSSFHHFAPDDARRILRDAAERAVGIGVFEAQCRSLRSLLLFLCYLPLTLAAAPLVRPFRISRLLWTYLLPVLPIAITFDALVSCLRTYEPEELSRLAWQACGDRMDVECGCLRARWLPLRVTFLLAVPRSAKG